MPSHAGRLLQTRRPKLPLLMSFVVENFLMLSSRRLLHLLVLKPLPKPPSTQPRWSKLPERSPPPH
jgi:hypothetical protein